MPVIALESQHHFGPTAIKREAFAAVVQQERNRPAPPVDRVDAERLQQRLLVMSWFRTKPEAWRRTQPLEAWD